MNKFFIREGCIWIRLQDHERQRKALFLPAKFCKLAICDAHGTILTGHDSVTKMYKIIFGQEWLMILQNIFKHVYNAKS